MPSWRIAVGLVLSAAAAMLFAYAGHVQLKRPALGEARLALQLFAVWWYALAAITVAGAAFNLLASYGTVDLALAQVWTYLALAGICLALWGMLYYLLYLFTGKRAWLPILSVFYALVYIFVLYWVQIQEPIGVKMDDWTAQLEYARPDTGPMTVAILLVIVLPQILAGFAYFTLYFRVRERAQRYRIAVVSWSIIAWFSTSLIAQAFPKTFRESDTWHILSRLIGLAASALIVMAYRPPSRIQRWLAADVGAPTEEGARQARGNLVRKTRPFASFARDFLVPVRELFRPAPVGALC